MITPNGIIGSTNSTAVNSNLAIGQGTLLNSRLGYYNLAIGGSSLANTESGYYNLGIGAGTLLRLSTGYKNICIGYGAGVNLNTGHSNIFIGHEADVWNLNAGQVSNSIIIGSEYRITSSNMAWIGNGQTNYIGGQVPWSNPSDRRLKENITYTNRLGLDFITRLQTASYNYIADKSKIRRDGFIAQDVENALSELGIPFSGLQKSEDGTYSLSYSDFVMPLVNAVKEQQEQINELKRQNENLAQTLADLKDIRAEIAKLKEQSTLRNTDKK